MELDFTGSPLVGIASVAVQFNATISGTSLPSGLICFEESNGLICFTESTGLICFTE